jgi:hypothetical protein
MEVLGHSQIAVTMNIYGHVMDPPLQDAADAVDGALWGKTEETERAELWLLGWLLGRPSRAAGTWGPRGSPPRPT